MCGALLTRPRGGLGLPDSVPGASAERALKRTGRASPVKSGAKAVPEQWIINHQLQQEIEANRAPSAHSCGSDRSDVSCPSNSTGSLAPTQRPLSSRMLSEQKCRLVSSVPQEPHVSWSPGVLQQVWGRAILAVAGTLASRSGAS